MPISRMPVRRALWLALALALLLIPARTHAATAPAANLAPTDVTRLVNSSGVVSLALAAAGPQRVVLASREDAAHTPRLALRYGATAASSTAPPALPSIDTPPLPAPAPSAPPAGGGSAPPA